MRFLTMKSVRIQIISLMLAGLISMPAHGEVIPGRWEKVSALELGTPITVELKNGDQVAGTFEGLFASEDGARDPLPSGGDSEGGHPDRLLLRRRVARHTAPVKERSSEPQLELQLERGPSSILKLIEVEEKTYE